MLPRVSTRAGPAAPDISAVLPYVRKAARRTRGAFARFWMAGKEIEAAPGAAGWGRAVHLPCGLSPAVLAAAPLVSPLLFSFFTFCPNPPALSLPPFPPSLLPLPSGTGPEMSRFRQRRVQMGRQAEECWFDDLLRLQKA